MRDAFGNFNVTILSKSTPRSCTSPALAAADVDDVPGGEGGLLSPSRPHAETDGDVHARARLAGVSCNFTSPFSPAARLLSREVEVVQGVVEADFRHEEQLQTVTQR